MAPTPWEELKDEPWPPGLLDTVRALAHHAQAQGQVVTGIKVPLSVLADVLERFAGGDDLNSFQPMLFGWPLWPSGDQTIRIRAVEKSLARKVEKGLVLDRSWLRMNARTYLASFAG
jgi:hypothetical protein